MKNLITIFFSLYTCICFGQQTGNYTYRVTYLMDHIPDTNNITQRHTVVCYLYLGNQGSYFAESIAVARDSILNSSRARVSAGQADLASGISTITSTQKPFLEYKIFKNPAKQQVEYMETVNRVNYQYSEPLSQIQWTLTVKQDTISGMQVHKATGDFRGRSYTAWYTQEIPVSDGPYKFAGLPGLIVKISDNEGHFKYEMAGLEKGDFNVVQFSSVSDIKETNRASFLAAKKNYYDNPGAFIDRPGVTMDEENKRKVIENIKARALRRSNEIERTSN